MKRAKNTAIWVATNLIYWYVVFLGMTSSHNALSLLKFYYWFGFIVTLLALASPKPMWEQKPLHAGLAATTDILVAFVLSWYGHFGLATLCVLQMLCEQALYDRAGKQAEQKVGNYNGD